MNLDERINAFIELGKVLKEPSSYPENLSMAIQKSQSANGWFIPEFVESALVNIGSALSEENIRKWLEPYKTKLENKKDQKVTGVIMAGNVPAVGFHDFLSILESGNIFKGKTSSTDPYLLPAIADILIEIEPRFKESITFTDARLGEIDQIIATGSNNTSRYFEYYFGKYPNIIRRNRNSAAILTGKETEEEIKLLGKDIFTYFGLGCRNVSKLFVPKGYDFDHFFKGIFDYSWVVNNNKYGNNYDYHKTLYLMKKTKLWDNGFIFLKEDIGLASPVASLFYENYNDVEELKDRLRMDKDHIQCLVASDKSASESAIPFGKTQQPELWDYADNVDTMKFLLEQK